MADDTAFTAKDLDGEVLQCFWDMAELDEGRRLTAAHKLVERVTTSSDSSSTVSPQLQEYVVKRLVKGTGSGRMAARQGFATAFTAYLAAQPSVTFASVVQLMDVHLAYSGSMKASEVKDLLLGRLFVYGALVKAGLVRALSDAEKVVAGVRAIGTQRSFMSEAVVTLVCELCECLDAPVRQELLRSSPDLAALLFVPAGEATAEVLLLAVRLWPHMPPDVAAKCSLLPHSPAPSSSVYSHPTSYSDADAAAAAAFFCGSHLATVAEPLKASSSSHPRLHDVWRHLLALLLPGFAVAAPDPEGADCQRSCRPGAGQLVALWTCVVEEHLMVSSHERKALGLQLFCILLPHLTASDVPKVFSPNFLRCIANSLKDKGSYLHKSAQKCLDRLVGWARKRHDSDGPESTDVRLAALLALAQYSKVGFDGISKSKAIARLQAALDIQAVRRHHDRLKAAFIEGRLPSEPDTEDVGEDDAAAAAESSRMWILAQLCGLLKVPACDEALAMDVLKFLAMVGFYDVQPAASKSKNADVKVFAACRLPISAPVRTLAVSRLAALATEVLPCLAPAKASGQAEHDPETVNGVAAHASEPPSDKQSDPQAAGRSGRILLTEVVAFIRKTSSLSAKHVRLWRDSDSAREARQQLAHMLAACSTAASAKHPGAAPLLHLLELMELMLYGDDSESTQSLVTDLQPVISAALSLDEPSGGDGGDESGDEDADVSGSGGQQTSWINRLTECLLSLLADSGGCVPVAVVRSSAEAVWRAFCGEMNLLALNDMLQVILRIDKQGAGDDMFEDEDDGDEADGGSEGNDDGSDAEVSDMDDGHDGEGPVPSPTEAAEPSDDESDEAMDDEAMFRIDGKLAEYFKSIRGGKQDAKAQAEALRNFQMRVLSLLEIWMKKQGDSDLLPLSVLPLLRALRAALRPSGYAPLANRLKAVLVQRLAASRPSLNADLSLPVLDSSDAVSLEGIMSKVMYLAAREKQADVRVAATKCYMMLLRSVAAAARGGGAGAQKGLSQQLSALVVEVFDKKKSHWGVSTTVVDVLKHCNVAGHLLPALLDKAAAARSEFLRIEALLACAAALRMVASDDAVQAAVRALRGPLVKVLASVASGGLSKPARWADALRHGAGCLESLQAMAGGAGGPACLGVDGAKQLRAAVGHGLSMEALPVKCQTQLQRWKKVLDSTKGASRGSAGTPAPDRSGPDAGSSQTAKPSALGKRKAHLPSNREPKKSKPRSSGAAEDE